MIPIFRPSYGPEEAEAVRKVLESGWTGMGPRVEEFEEKFAAYIGTKYAVAVNSGTAALFLAVNCLNDGRPIISTPLTFVSTNHVILQNGCQPIWGDISRHTLCLDLDTVKDEDWEMAQGVIGVHFGGQTCHLEQAKAHGLWVIEDVAHACGSSFFKRKLGSIGDMGCFSFHAVKNLSCGDGGMVTTDDLAMAAKLRRLRWLGIDKTTWDRGQGSYGWNYEVNEVGWKCHMNDLTAAIGLVQLAKLDEMNTRRRRLAQRYFAAFDGHYAIYPDIMVPIELPGIKSAWHLYWVQVEDRDGLHERLKADGIASGVHYRPNYHYPMYERGDCPVTDEVWQNLLTLPLYPDMTDAEQDRVIDTVLKHIGRFYGGAEKNLHRDSSLRFGSGADPRGLHEVQLLPGSSVS